MKVLVDHFGVRDSPRAPAPPGFQAVLRARPRGPRRREALGALPDSRAGPTLADLDPYAEALLEAFGLDGCVWGSDWPFLDLADEPAMAPPRGPAALAARRGRPRAGAVGQSRAAVRLRRRRRDAGARPAPLRVALAGAGMISRYHLLAWRTLGGGSELVGVCDPDLGRAAGARAGVRHPRRLSADPTPCWTRPARRARHRLAARDAMRPGRGRGRARHRRALPEAARADAGRGRGAGRGASPAGCRLMVHENWRFRPWYRRLRALDRRRVRWASCCPGRSCATLLLGPAAGCHRPAPGARSASPSWRTSSG